MPLRNRLMSLRISSQILRKVAFRAVSRGSSSSALVSFIIGPLSQYNILACCIVRETHCGSMCFHKFRRRFRKIVRSVESHLFRRETDAPRYVAQRELSPVRTWFARRRGATAHPPDTGEPDAPRSRQPLTTYYVLRASRPGSPLAEKHARRRRRHRLRSAGLGAARRADLRHLAGATTTPICTRGRSAAGRLPDATRLCDF